MFWLKIQLQISIFLADMILKNCKMNIIMYRHKKYNFLFLLLTMLSSFWYCGIFFNIWERSLMLAWKEENVYQTFNIPVICGNFLPWKSVIYGISGITLTLSVLILLLSQKVRRSSVTFLQQWNYRKSSHPVQENS